MFNWEIIGYLGIFFASVYRIPQITKIYRTKKGGDVSKKSFLLQNAAYIALIIYVCGKQKGDIILIIYYIIGLIQNIAIIIMKEYYKRVAVTIEDNIP
jgi:uncharacterized protein with PQ loop repeat